MIEYQYSTAKSCRQRTTAGSMLGRFNQRPSIKSTPAQCPAAAKGFIRLVISCAMQELPTFENI